MLHGVDDLWWGTVHKVLDHRRLHLLHVAEQHPALFRHLCEVVSCRSCMLLARTTG